MKLNLILLLIIVVSGVIFFKPSFSNKANEEEVVLSSPSSLTPPSKPDLQEELLVAGVAGTNAGEVADEILAGYQFAQQQAITSHANCIVMEEASKKEGCHRYVNDQQQVPPYINRESSLEHITANQCRTETTAYYEAVEKDMLQQVMGESVLSQLKTDWDMQLEICNKYPYKALGLAELQPIILEIEKTGEVKPEDLRAILIDIAEKGAFADTTARKDYINNIENFFPRITTAGSADSVNCQLHKQQVDVLSAALAAINAFKQDKLELWSSVVLQRKTLLWKKMLLSSEVVCDSETEQ